MARPTPLSGFPELLPAERIIEQQVLDTLRTTFELHGFAGIETRSVEPLDQLLRKGETSKEVYVLRRLQETSPEGHAGMGLHFDLTVPFARYVLENAGKLEFPFRRYQIQKVWRGERPQEGRFREFTQADIDVVGRDDLPFHHDVEVARAMVDALTRIDFLPPFRLQLNNRRLVAGYYAGLGLDDTQGEAAMRTVDKLDKLDRERVRDLLLTEVTERAEVADAVLRLADVRGDSAVLREGVEALGVGHPLLEQGLAELAEVIDACQDLAGPRARVEADLSVARGLDYYTGTVFETRLDGFERIGSICSGGRYESLASDGRTTYPGVGISFGLTRTLSVILARGGLRAIRSVPSAVLIAVVDEDSRAQSDAVAAALRSRGIPCEVAAAAQKFGKQIRAAERRGIPFVWFGQDDGSHQVKDIRSGDQVEADPATWTPPPADLRPQVVTAHHEEQPQ